MTTFIPNKPSIACNWLVGSRASVFNTVRCRSYEAAKSPAWLLHTGGRCQDCGRHALDRAGAGDCCLCGNRGNRTEWSPGLAACCGRGVIYPPQRSVTQCAPFVSCSIPADDSDAAAHRLQDPKQPPLGTWRSVTSGVCESSRAIASALQDLLVQATIVCRTGMRRRRSSRSRRNNSSSKTRSNHSSRSSSRGTCSSSSSRRRSRRQQQRQQE